MTGPLVSCIVPVYNGERFLREAIDSIFEQTYRPLEVVVVDDGSTDGTRAVVDAVTSPVRYVWQANAGPAAARNRGIASSSGELVAFLDADDRWDPARLAAQVAALEADPGLAFSVCLIQDFFMPGHEPASEAERNHPRHGPTPGYVATGMVVRRTALERVGGFDPDLGHGDSADWCLRARAAGLRDALVNEVLVHRRLHGANRSTMLADASRDEFLHLIKRSLDARRRTTRPPSTA